MLAGDFASLFPRVGIRPVSLRPVSQGMAGGDLTYLIPFENLTARDRAWTALNADAQWTGARARFQSYHFGLYEVA